MLGIKIDQVRLRIHKILGSRLGTERRRRKTRTSKVNLGKIGEVPTGETQLPSGTPKLSLRFLGEVSKGEV